ncbi:MAG: rane protein of unknown function [Candidatus Saccharibacteria bacterium]|nr:rane protein of unknown function [Candidatus Saccharibacteria bacterium]
MKIQLKKFLRISPFVLTLSVLVALAGSSVAHAAPALQDNGSSAPNANAEYHKLCTALKNISNGKLYKDNCHNDDTQSHQNKAVKNICNRNITRLSDECDAYDAAIAVAANDPNRPHQDSYSLGTSDAKYSCGDAATNQSIDTAIDFGCSHKGPAMLDLAFAVIRFLSNGAGLIIIGSLVWGGLQYTLSRGDPQSTAMAVTRMRSVVLALFIYIFAYAILNYLIPGVVLK